VISPHREAILPCSGVIPPHGKLASPCGKVVLPHGKLISPHSEVIPPHGEVARPCSKVIPPHGNLTSEDGFSAKIEENPCFLTETGENQDYHAGIQTGGGDLTILPLGKNEARWFE
jgi:hypothetical protein